MMLLVAWIGAASFVAFALTIWDKRVARTGSARVAERVLLGVALAGGSPGLVLGMLVARHKTRKASFLLALAVVIGAQVATALWLLR